MGVRGFEERALVWHLGVAGSHQPLAPTEGTPELPEKFRPVTQLLKPVWLLQELSGDSGHTLGTL